MVPFMPALTDFVEDNFFVLSFLVFCLSFLCFLLRLACNNMKDVHCCSIPCRCCLKPSDALSPDESSKALDRLSELPDHILHKILSCLPAKQVSQTSVLSTRWSVALKSFPVLDFDAACFGLVERYSSKIDEIAKHDSDKFMKHVDGSVQQFVEQKLRMKRFKLSTTSLLDHDSVSLVDKWIGLAVDNLVEEIDLAVGVRPVTYYPLPEIVFAAASLKVLSLSGCKLNLPFAIVKLISLRKLSLRSVQLDELIVDRIITSCPCIEDLTFKWCWDSDGGCLKNLKISGLDRLKTAEISMLAYEIESIHIEAPNLEKLIYYSCSYLNNFPSGFQIRVSSSLKDVSLWGASITDQCLLGLLSNAIQIEKLELSRCHKLEKVKISSNLLSGLEIMHCSKLEEVEVDAPNLYRFWYDGKPLRCFTHRSPLCSTTVYLPDGLTFCEWLDFLSSRLQYRQMQLHLNLKSQGISCKRLRKVSVPVVWKIKHLELDVRSPSSNYSALLASVLVSCKPTVLRVWTRPEAKNNFTKYLYWRLKQGASSGCTKASSIKCWRHQLKNVKNDYYDFPDKFPSPRWRYGSLKFKLEWRSQTPPLPEKEVTHKCENEERADDECSKLVSRASFTDFFKRWWRNR